MGVTAHSHLECITSVSLSSLWTTAPVAIRPHHACNLCGARHAYVVCTRDRDRRPLRTVVCRECGLVWTDPRPSDEAIAAYYSHEYRQNYKGAHQPKRRHLYRAAAVAHHRFNRLHPLLAHRHRILDVGASSGEFVHVLRASGKDAIGIEPHEGYSRWARETLRLPVITADWTQARFAPGSFEAITLFHVAEHLVDPRGALAQLVRWLAPGGMIAIEVPNVEADCGSPRRRFHFAHLHHFNLPTLRALGKAVGLEVVFDHTSPDRGNILVVFRLGAMRNPIPPHLPTNCARVQAALAGHTVLAHYLSVRTWMRPLRKLRRSLREAVAVQRHRSPVALVEAARATSAD